MGLWNLKDILSANICTYVSLLNAFVYFCQIKPSEIPAIVVLSSYRLTLIKNNLICWRLKRLVLLTGAAKVNKPYCSVKEVTQKSGNISGVEAAQEFSPRLSMLLSIRWMETQAICFLTQLLLSWRAGDPLGCDLDHQAVWREIRAVLRFEQCCCIIVFTGVE